MPTYSWRCDACGEVTEMVMSIRDYCAAPRTFFHCAKPMERFFQVAPGMALGNALAGDRHYDGLRAQDGTDISTRDKHRRYMKERGVTMASDFTQTWANAAKERSQVLTGSDKSRASDVAQAVEKLSRST